MSNGHNRHPMAATETEEKLGVKFPASFVTAMSRMTGGTVKTKIDTFECFRFWMRQIENASSSPVEALIVKLSRRGTDGMGFPPRPSLLVQTVAATC